MSRNPRHVRSIVDHLLSRWEKGTAKKGAAVLEAWAQAADEETQRNAHPVSLKNATLTVIVGNSVWLYNLTMKKKDLLEKFNNIYVGKKKARDMKIRIGAPDA